ncbi:MAG: hypothetical protein ACYS9T_10970 [Planctomycetota bacterium]|jgi:hypothetical protein
MPDAIKDFFQSLYSRFILRELLGKMMPGGIVMLSCVVGILDLLDKDIIAFFLGCPRLPFGIWIYLFGISWLFGLGIQQVGERSWRPIRLRYFPDKEFRESYEGYHIANETEELRTWYELSVKFENSSPKPRQQQQLERLGIIKDACGISGYSIAISLVLLSLSTFLKRVSDIGDWFKNIIIPFLPGIMLLFVICVALLLMHRAHVKREYLLMISVVNASRKGADVVRKEGPQVGQNYTNSSQKD